MGVPLSLSPGAGQEGRPVPADPAQDAPQSAASVAGQGVGSEGGSGRGPQVSGWV